ncbi:hypothetical protein LTS08_007061 [Lithohypha guttulata]|nr:hypothetical protein LTS08_007061 [Lithohypha guttulata]
MDLDVENDALAEKSQPKIRPSVTTSIRISNASANDMLTADTTAHVLSATNNHGSARWGRLAKSYSDQYVELFTAEYERGEVKRPLETSQLGSVIWTGEEKETFFEALARKGRHDLQALSNLVGTKSVVEVQDYLYRLKEAERERHMFFKHAKRIAHPEIDAAIDIDAELEDELEEAADALAALQDFYDESAAKSKGTGTQVIDSAFASTIDTANDAEEDGHQEEDLDTDDDQHGLQLFRFDMLLELSRALFMNMPNSSQHHHWLEIAEDNEEPSITIDAVESLFNLVKSITQRILQTAIFLAQSRIRSTTIANYSPSNVLKTDDIDAALNVLRMPADSFDYWIDYLKRSRSQIVLGGHRKGEQKAILALGDAQRMLSVRGTRGRRRSLSAINMTSQKLNGDAGHIEERTDQHFDVISDDDDASHSFEASRTAQSLDSDGGSHAEEETASGNDRRHSDDDTDRSGNSQRGLSGGRLSYKRRRLMLEEAEDEFMESLDHAASIREGNYIRSLLGINIGEGELDFEPGRRPPKFRKTREELADWTDISYKSPWEHG